MASIPLPNGMSTVVDDADHEWLSQWKWWCDHKNYVRRMANGQAIFMHREILGTPPGLYTDHINRDSLDNRRANLRVVTTSQNKQNSAAHRGSTSKYKGVYWHKNRQTWNAGIRHNGKHIHIGTFPTEETAARAYDCKARELFGQFARCNFED